MAIRSPICVVVGHVDHGKSSLLDYIRGTRIIAKEAGGITQAIGASIIPMDIIHKICGPLLGNKQFSIPGLLFIDTPGHAAFSSLRKRGGALADIAILVVDINEGLMPQTIEAMQILKESKTPFVVAANKIDLVKGYEQKNKQSVVASITAQAPRILQEFETKLYTLVGAFHEQGFASERFDRVRDYTKELAIVPISAKSGEGMPELLMVLSGLAQKYLEGALQFNVDGPAIGTVLEVKEEKGLGTTLDVVLYDGTLRAQDDVVIGGLDAPIVAKIRVLLQPSVVADMRDKSVKFSQIKEAVAATGVKISGPGLEKAIAGMPIRSVAGQNIEELKEKVQQDVANVLIETDAAGVILKADTLGGIEALIHLCKHSNIPIRKARIGEITKKDIIDAESSFEKDPLLSCILGFNVKQVDPTEKTNIITSRIIYDLIDKYKEWKEKVEKILYQKHAASLARPGKLLFLPNHTFRQNNPAIVGIDVLGGSLRRGSKLIKQDGSAAGVVKNIQLNKENVDMANWKDQVAVSIEGVTVGRQISENDILYVELEEADFRALRDVKEQLQVHEKDSLKEFVEIKRKQNPFWGI